MCVHACSQLHGVGVSENNLGELFFSLQHVCPRDQTQVVLSGLAAGPCLLFYLVSSDLRLRTELGYGRRGLNWWARLGSGVS